MKGKAPAHLIITAHASQVMEERAINIAWVEQVILNPEHTETHETDPELEHRFGTITERKGRVLHVVVSKSQPRRLITVYFDRNRKGMP